MVMEKMVHVKQVIVLPIQQDGTTMDQLLRYRITIRLMELLRMQVPDRGQQEELNFSF